MTRRTMADRKQRAAERDTRRDALLVLLSRMDRGALAEAERAMLRAAVVAELTESDELRRTVAGQQTAIQRAHDRTTAAEAAIVEAEQRAEQAEALLRRYVQLADVTHRYPAMGGHDCIGADLTCAGCALRDEIRTTLDDPEQ